MIANFIFLNLAEIHIIFVQNFEGSLNSRSGSLPSLVSWKKKFGILLGRSITDITGHLIILVSLLFFAWRWNTLPALGTNHSLNYGSPFCGKKLYQSIFRNLVLIQYISWNEFDSHPRNIIKGLLPLYPIINSQVFYEAYNFMFRIFKSSDLRRSSQVSVSTMTEKRANSRNN